ncbi:MAG: hypothetical protein IJE78_05085 [Bacteroidaceae bacterium]|nr:hypothetical protein [Bacteroidaceae bacterium]
MKFEIERCSDLNCKYAHSELVCPEDSFDEDVIAYCKHPDAPEKSGLGCDDNPDYMKIPDWCPRRCDPMKDAKSEDITSIIEMRINNVIEELNDMVVLKDYLRDAINDLFSVNFTSMEIKHALRELVDAEVDEVEKFRKAD